MKQENHSSKTPKKISILKKEDFLNKNIGSTYKVQI
jgi:hypothetical protein